MKVTVKTLGIPELRLYLPSPIKINFDGTNLGELLQVLAATYGSVINTELLEEQGRLRETIQVIINNKIGFHRDNIMSQQIRSDDEIIFMAFVGGG